MSMRLGGSVAQQREWLWVRLIAAVFLLGAAVFQTTGAIAQDEAEPCEFEEGEGVDTEEADTTGCLAQEGDNLAGNNDDFKGDGGDGVGGSNVIGGAGTGRTRINADNTSEFSDAEGGSTESHSQTTIDNGPELTIEGGNQRVVAEATGISTVDQVAAPTVDITLEQVASATGLSTVSNTASAATTLSGSNIFAGTSGVSPT
ncbi:MAG: hypothetical protein ACRDHK_12080, partial [Actinomycetota bacterium]